MPLSKKRKQNTKRETDLKNELNLLRRENIKLRDKNELQTAVLEAIEEVNHLLSKDDRGKELLWTKNYPHNLDPETAEKIQEALKKSPQNEDSKLLLAKAFAATDKE